MKSMYYVTLRHGAAFAYEIERLWTTVASNKHNIIPILEFLISLGLQEIHSGVSSGHLLGFQHLCRVSLKGLKSHVVIIHHRRFPPFGRRRNPT